MISKNSLKLNIAVTVALFLNLSHITKCNVSVDDILVYTVATSETDGFRRYLQSAQEYRINPIVLGFGEEWKGGNNIKNEAGGGWKVNLLREALQQHIEDKDKIVLFTDAYDVMFLDDLTAIIDAFKRTNARILFGAESFCWPDKTLASKYPNIMHGKPYLNSGLYMGYMPEILELLEQTSLENTDDDQLFFTLTYLDEKLREQLKFKLDHNSEIFQNLNGATNDVELSGEEKEGEIYLRNVISLTKPLIVHGNGKSKLKLNSLGNYLARAWNSDDGCRHCNWGHIDLENKPSTEMPVVLISVFIEQPTPFFESQLNKVHSQKYPKNRIHLFIHNSIKFHKDHVKNFIKNHGKEYLSVKELKPEDAIPEWTARDLSLDQCLNKECDLYFSVDSVSHLDNPHTLRLLAEQNHTVVSPLLPRPGKPWSNFWGALTADGFYSRSDDYMNIVYNKKRGLWNVPFINAAYLINGTLLRQHDRSKLSFVHGNLDADMAFCANLRELDVFMFVSNRIDFGHLVDAETYDTTVVAPDMYQIFENELDWEQKYIHSDYPEIFNPEKKNAQPCPDVYWVPVVSLQFCNELIQMMEGFGKWSDGKNNDARLEGGYEAVPTRDIHMNQVGWERHWLYILKKYVRPVQEYFFIGYFHDPPRSLMNFVVRYRPGEQPSLRPHHDSSTYTINIALNKKGVDYEGGGCHFLRYNCSIVDTKPGWLLMHPGRLTHYHEGLEVTKGTRYIMISFVDP